MNLYLELWDRLIVYVEKRLILLQNLKVLISGVGQATTSGRTTGTAQFEEFECPAAKRVPLSQDHFIQKLDDVRSKLKTANEEVSKLLETVKEKDLVIKEKTSLIRSSSKKIVDLQRQVQHLGKYKHDYVLYR